MERALGISVLVLQTQLVVNNAVFANAGGINLTGSSSSGYMGNVLSNNGGNNVSGGTSMGHNLCDAVAC